MQTHTNPTTPATHLDAEIERITSDGKVELYPSTAAKLGRKFLIHLHGKWVGIRVTVPHAEIGVGVFTLEHFGVDWHDLSTPEQVVARAEAIRGLAANPLVTERQLPLSWLVDVSGETMGVNGLSAVASAIELAETLDEDWSTWPQRYSATAIVTIILPALQAQADEKQALEIEALAATEVKIEAAPAPVETKAPYAKVELEPTAHQRLFGKARKEQRRLEAIARNGAPKATPAPAKPEAPKPGTLVLVNGVEHAVCTGKHGACGLLVPMSELRVPASIGWARNAIGNILERPVRFEELTPELLALVGFCPEDAARALKSGHQSVTEALVARDSRLAEIEGRRTEEKAKLEAEAAQKKAKADAQKAEADRKREADRVKRERARRAANGGAFGSSMRVSWMTSSR